VRRYNFYLVMAHFALPYLTATATPSSFTQVEKLHNNV
jgi:hypothetical protein